MLSDFDKHNVGNIVRGEGTWFSACLIRLISKADLGNRELLRKVYPDHVAAYEAWHAGEGDR